MKKCPVCGKRVDQSPRWKMEDGFIFHIHREGVYMAVDVVDPSEKVTGRVATPVIATAKAKVVKAIKAVKAKVAKVGK